MTHQDYDVILIGISSKTNRIFHLLVFGQNKNFHGDALCVRLYLSAPLYTFDIQRVNVKNIDMRLRGREKDTMVKYQRTIFSFCVLVF